MHRLSKLVSSLVLAAAVSAALPAGAQFRGPSATEVSTVAQAAEARPDTNVVLTGHIIARQFDDYFTFKDDTGTMTVEIDRRQFRGREVTPDTKVRLTGEVEVNRRGRYIDVHRLEIL